MKVKLSETRRTIKGPKSMALTSLSRHDIHQRHPSSVKCSLLTFCQLSPAVSSWGPCQRTEGGSPKFPTLQIISGIFKDYKINHPRSCNFTSKSRKKLPDNEHFALIRTVGLIRFKLLADILMVNEAALKMPLDSLET